MCTSARSTPLVKASASRQSKDKTVNQLPIYVKDNWLFIRKSLWDAVVSAPSPLACDELLQSIRQQVNADGTFAIVGGGDYDSDISLTGHRQSEVEALRLEVEQARKAQGLPPLPES